MRRTELVNMIKTVRSLGFPDLSPRTCPLPKSTVAPCFVTIKIATESQTLLFCPSASSSPNHDQEKA